MSRHLFRTALAVAVMAVGIAYVNPAQAADNPDKPKHHQFTGAIDSVDAKAGTVSVSSKKMGSKTFTCDATCKMSTADKKDATLADLKAGDKVVVTYTEGADGKMTCHKIAPPAPKKDMPPAAK